MKHNEVWELIPWLVNGTVPESQKRDADAHVANCGECRSEIDAQRQLVNEMRGESSLEYVPSASFQKLSQRIARQRTMQPADAAQIDRTAPGPVTRWLMAAALVEAIGIAVLGGALLTQRMASRENSYRTLSTVGVATHAATIRAVFANVFTVQQMHTVLRGCGLVIVAGPSDAGVYTLAPASAHAALPTASCLSLLRAQPGVLFAEDISAAR
jgi:hypothetical protein